MKMQEQVALAPYTTLRVGGPAQFFCSAASEDDFAEALAFASDKNLPVFLLGGGSNLLISDAGFPGLVIRMAIEGLERHGDTLRVGAGVGWETLVQFAVTRDLAGIECLSGIPGTVGATPVQNVGAYGQEVSETIVSVRALHRATGKFVQLTNEECHFAYRTSLFNTTAKNEYSITSVDFQLRPGAPPTLKYAELAKHFAEKSQPTLKEVAETVRSVRNTKAMVTATPQPDGQYPADIPPDTRSAGSFFRNPIVERGVYERIAASFANVPHWPAGDQIKLPAAWLIEQAGIARGFALGRAAISSRHTLALTNLGGATAAEIIALRDAVIAKVQDRFEITLEQEPVSVP